MSSVFKDVLKKPLFAHFSTYCSENISKEEKIKAYAAFVGEIYESGMTLSALANRLVAENENVYIKSMAHGSYVSDQIKNAVKAELENFEEFSKITPDMFMEDMAVSYVSPYLTESIDFVSCYQNRVDNVDKLGYGIFSSYGMFRLSDDREIEPIKIGRASCRERVFTAV